MTKEDTPLPLLSEAIEEYRTGTTWSKTSVTEDMHLQRIHRMALDLEADTISRDAKIKSLENEVARLQGATNFETVPKEAYDRLEGLVQELEKERDDLIVECHRMASQILEDMDPTTSGLDFEPTPNP